jgi:hypothetical protein
MRRTTNGSRKANVWVLGILLLLLTGGLAHATIVDVNIYNSTTIGDGDEYGWVNIYDTPPYHTTVDMIGGSVNSCCVYDGATLNYDAGEIPYIEGYDNSIINVHSDYIGGIVIAHSCKAFLYNGSSNFTVGFGAGAELHVFGYNLIYTPVMPGSPGFVDGCWESGESFHILIRPSTGVIPNVILHEIPEPCSGLILTILTIFARYRKSKFKS